MADPAYYPPSIPQDGQLDPELQDAGGVFSTEDSRNWSQDILKDIQQFQNARTVANTNAAAGQQFVQNVASTKNNLLGMVHDDPTSVDLALKLAPKFIGPMLEQTGLEGDQLVNAHNDLTSNIQAELSHSAVMRMADYNATAAHSLLDNVSGYIDEPAQNTLRQYIDTLQSARIVDTAGSQATANSMGLRRSAQNAYQYATSLLDARTEQTQFPKDYLANLVRDQSMRPIDKAPLFSAYSQLAANGDPPVSDPYTVNAILHNIVDPYTPVSHDDIMSHVGGSMRYADALMLHGLNLQRTPESQENVRQLRDVIDDARTTLASDGGRAGDAAFSRFVNWLLPAYRRSGVSGLDPAADNYLLKDMTPNKFAPTHSDAVRPNAVVGKRPLSAIFGNG